MRVAQNESRIDEMWQPQFLEYKRVKISNDPSGRQAGRLALVKSGGVGREDSKGQA